MRLGLLDLLFVVVSVSLGALLGRFFGGYLPVSMRLPAMLLCGIGMYASLICPFYCHLRLFPMILPRCPCCGYLPAGYHVEGCWPRIYCRCHNCQKEFLLWMNGHVDEPEPESVPVLVLRWPYAFGRYIRVNDSYQPQTAGASTCLIPLEPPIPPPG
jgi:hypothetical protein